MYSWCTLGLHSRFSIIPKLINHGCMYVCLCIYKVFTLQQHLQLSRTCHLFLEIQYSLAFCPQTYLPWLANLTRSFAYSLPGNLIISKHSLGNWWISRWRCWGQGLSQVGRWSDMVIHWLRISFKEEKKIKISIKAMRKKCWKNWNKVF